MSVATEKPVSTTIKAATDVDCFLINTENFDSIPNKERDHFLALFYKVYTVILADRLVKTNEKARLFEIANREIHQAQVTLDKLGDKSVLLVEPDRKQLMLAKMAVGATGVRLDVASDMATALELTKHHKYNAVICDESLVELLKKLKAENYPTRLVLMTQKGVQKNIPVLRNMVDIDNVISRDPDDRSLTVRMLLTTLTKVLTGELFGLEKYMSWGVEISSKPVLASHQRSDLKDEMAVHLKKQGVRNTILDRCVAVTEEMLMNAIYDAPTDSQGRAIYNHLSRKTEVVLDSHLQSQIRYACDGVMLGISVVDPFGALTKKIILDYLESCYEGFAGSLNDGKGGAGRGLHQIIENADLTIFNVRKGVKTEVICLFNIEGSKRETVPSFHYFFSE
jgi:CheY-like chemotaxis protein